MGKTKTFKLISLQTGNWLLLYGKMPRYRGVLMYVDSIGVKSKNINDLILQVKKGLPTSSFEKLRKKFDISDNLLSQIVSIPKRTLNRRKQQGRLSAVESERVLRIARLYDQALDVFEDEEAVENWFKKPARALAGTTPLKYADTELGAQEVERLLIRIEHGVFPG
jgi:putative toxin-antitoxin system antitoxin component (TIGR02293 family)